MDIQFIPVDAAVIEKMVLAKLEEGTGETLFPGDERRIFGEAMTMTAVALMNLFNDEAKQRMLMYARGAVLDALGDMRGVKRLEATKAKVRLRFSLGAPAVSSVTIPAGTKASTTGELYFATDMPVVIYAGTSTADVWATSIEGGA